MRHRPIMLHQTRPMTSGRLFTQSKTRLTLSVVSPKVGGDAKSYSTLDTLRSTKGGAALRETQPERWHRLLWSCASEPTPFLRATLRRHTSMVARGGLRLN